MTPTIERVLVATDGSDPAARAARHGVALAAAMGADVHAISVVERDAKQLVLAALGDDDPSEGMAGECKHAVEDVAALAEDREAIPSVTTEVRRGRPHVAIGEYADEVGVDVIVAGTEGRSGIDRVLLGSVAENLLRTARVPVLVLPPDAGEPGGAAGDEEAGAPAPYERLLLPTDGSESAARALDWALWLAGEFDGRLDALFAADTTPYPGTAQSRQLLESLEAAGNEAIQSARERAAAADVTFDGAVGSGAPGPTILEFCDDESVDLVVMGTHGRSGIERALLGSVTEYVVRHGNVPVFCVPPAARED